MKNQLKLAIALCAAVVGTAADRIQIGSPAPVHAIEVRNSSTNVVLTVNGIVETSTNSWTNLWKWKRPKTADEVVVELWTLDGKHYRAKWEIVKPQ